MFGGPGATTSSLRPKALSPFRCITPTMGPEGAYTQPGSFPASPVPTLRESFPRLRQRSQQGSQLNREKQESAALVPTSCSIPSWMRPVGIHRGSLELALTFPRGYTSSHQRKHLCSFCPESSCWAHCRRAVISEAPLPRSSASTCSTELFPWRGQTEGKTVPPRCLARPEKPHHSSNT